MIKIVWDWNGTLLDDVRLCLACINHLLTNNNLPPLQDLQAYRTIFGFPIRDYYQRAGFDFSKVSWEELAAAYMQEYMEASSECSLTEGAVDALYTVKSYGFDNIVLSASRLGYLQEQIAWYPIGSLIDAVYGIDDIYAHSKLELSRNFLKTCLPGDTLYFVGDSLHDFENAREIGAKCILVETGHQSREKLLQAGVPVVKGPMEAVRLILKSTRPMPYSLTACLQSQQNSKHEETEWKKAAKKEDLL